jgi:hypothetical protein
VNPPQGPQVLETVTRTAPFGVRFWDPVTGRTVVDGLVLTETASGTEAIANRDGVFVFHDLPGLRASAFAEGDARFWSSPPAWSVPTFELQDRTGSFVPFTFAAPVPARGLFAENLGPVSSPPDGAAAAVPLFSAPTRLVPGGTAVVRAQLRNTATRGDAAAAVVEVTVPGGATHRGIADSRGRVAVLFSYPEPPPTVAHAAGHALASQTWQLTVGVRCARPGSPPPSLPPDLVDALSQPLARVAASGTNPPAAQMVATLSFGVELVLRTPGQSELLVLPT